MSVRTCPQEDHKHDSLLYLSVNHAGAPASFSSPWRDRERETGREKERESEQEGRIIIQDLPSPSLRWHANRHQPPGERERQKRDWRLTRFRGLWSIKGLRRNSKTTPTIRTNVVSARVCVCVWVMCMVVCLWMCVQFKGVWRVVRLTCGGIGAGTSGSCEQPGFVFLLGGCCMRRHRSKKNLLHNYTLCVCVREWSTWGSVYRSGSIAGWGPLLYDFVGTSSAHGNSGNDSGSGWLPGSSSYKVHTEREDSSVS